MRLGIVSRNYLSQCEVGEQRRPQSNVFDARANHISASTLSSSDIERCRSYGSHLETSAVVEQIHGYYLQHDGFSFSLYHQLTFCSITRLAFSRFLSLAVPCVVSLSSNFIQSRRELKSERARKKRDQACLDETCMFCQRINEQDVARLQEQKDERRYESFSS